jgi:hypothetical protein
MRWLTGWLTGCVPESVQILQLALTVEAMLVTSVPQERSDPPQVDIVCIRTMRVLLPVLEATESAQDGLDAVACLGTGVCGLVFATLARMHLILFASND